MEEDNRRQWIFSRLDIICQDALEELKSQHDEFERRIREAQDNMISGRKELTAGAAAAIAIILGIAALGEAYRFLLQFLLAPISIGFIVYFSLTFAETYRQRKYGKVFDAFEQSTHKLLRAKNELSRLSMHQENISITQLKIITSCCEACIAASLVPLWQSFKVLSKAAFDSQHVQQYSSKHTRNLIEIIEDGFEKRSEVLTQAKFDGFDQLLKLSEELEQAHHDIHNRKKSKWWG